MSVFIIAEAGSNHCGVYDKAVNMVVEAAKAGADAIKFQTFSPEEIAANNVLVPRGTDLEHDKWLDSHKVKYLRDLFHSGLPREWHKELKHIAADNNIEFISTPFSVDAAKFLIEEIGVSTMKIASGDITFKPLLEYVNKNIIRVILSTGCSYFLEVEQAVNLLSNIYKRDMLSILHCVSVYPCDKHEVNLNSIHLLNRHFKIANIGFSDHTTSISSIPVLAVAAGAQIIEKHFNIDENGIDNPHSITPQMFKEMVNSIRDTEKIMGDFVKKPHKKEMHDRLWARRSETDWLRPTEEARLGMWE